MQKFKKIFSKIKNDSIFRQIIDSNNLRQQRFVLAIQQFSQFDKDKKQETFEDIICSFERQKSPRTILLTLLLIDKLHSQSPQIILFKNDIEPKVQKDKSNSTHKIQKINIAEEQFIKFYYEFLKKLSKKTENQINFDQCRLQEWIQYCEITVTQILQLIKIDFILNFLLRNSLNIEIIKKCLENIFLKISFDFLILNRFLQKFARIITQKNNYSFRINEIYEKVLFINSNFQKFNLILKNLDKKIEFQKYQFDKELNRSIQIEMSQRELQKRDYLIISQRKIFQTESDECKNPNILLVQGQTMIRLNDCI